MRKIIGLIGIIASTLIISLEIYMLKVIQAMEMVSGECYTNAWNYLSETPCAVGVLISVGMLVFSIIIFVQKGKN